MTDSPALSGRELIAYVAAGIRSDHESTTVEEARARSALGMLVQVREGSSAQNLDALLPLLASGELDDSWCLVTDDIFPSDLKHSGHLNGLLKRLVTRMYFPDEPRNADDRVLQLVPAERRGTLIARPNAKDTLEWNIILQGSGETVFFDC